jgi:hypothetical protein
VAIGLEKQVVRPRGTPDRKPVTALLLDGKNPRLSEDIDDFSQQNLLRIMERDFDLFPIAISMVSNGYFEEEALLVIPSKETGRFVVVEGNRRLAALLFLTSAASRRLSADPKKWEILAEQLRANRHMISEVPVRIYSSREDLDDYLAYRHISGTLKWDPREKARFVNGIAERRGFKIALMKLANDTGFSNTSTVKAYFLSYRIYLQAKQWEIDVSKVEINYSLFYTALNYLSIRQYLGIQSKETNLENLKEPVPEGRKEQLNELIEFVNGTQKRPPVIRESRDIADLNIIIANRDALDSLRRHRDISFALSIIEGEEHSFVENLQSASYYLDQALKYAHRHKDSKEAAKWVHKCSGTMTEIEKHFP